MNILCEDEVFIDDRTSCTKDEAAAKMLGWMTSFQRKQFINLTKHCAIPPDELPFLHSLEDASLKKTLALQRRATLRDLSDTILAGTTDEVIGEKMKAVLECNDLIEKALWYLADIDDELAKGEFSVLKIHQEATKESGVIYITLSSLAEWACNRHNISIRNSSDPKHSTDKEFTESPLRRGPQGGMGKVETNIAEGYLSKSLPQSQESESTDKSGATDGVNHNQKTAQKMHAQEKAILDEIKKLGYDNPRKLPKHKSGGKGVRAEVKASIGKDQLFRSTTAFKHAWDRLLEDGFIAYDTKHPPMKIS